MRDMVDDDAAGRALRTLNDDPAPPVATSIDQVLRRGRRRVFVQRAAAVAGVVAVVAGIGTATVLLRSSGEPGGGGVEVAVSTTAPPTPTGPLPGWETIQVDKTTCQRKPLQSVPGRPPSTLLPQSVVQPAFTSAIESVVGVGTTATEAVWEDYSPKAQGPRGYLAVEVPMDNGNGQLQLEAEVYPGTPAQMADASLFTYGDCKPPARHVMPDGTVLQLFQPNPYHPEQPMQHLQVYRPDGRMYVITAAGWSDADLVPLGGGGYTVEGGRGKLPVTQQQLADIATGLVAKLG
ncbi:hypothetical protein [Actinophytocola sp. KF-1]